MAEQKKLSELSPDSVDDQENKKYEDPDLMSLIDEVTDDDGSVRLADGEVPDAKLETKREERKLEKKVENKVETETEEEATNKFVEESTEEVTDKDIVDKEVSESDKPEKESEEKKQELKLSESVVSALKPYNGNLEYKIEQLVKSYNEAQAKISKLQHVQNVINEIGFGEFDQNRLVESMKQLKSTAFDIMNNPEVLDIIEGVINGNIPDKYKQEEKTVLDFMPEDEVFDSEDSLTDDNSPSWKAREKWEQWKFEQRQKRMQLANSIKNRKSSISNNPEIMQQLEENRKKIENVMKNVKSFAVDEYDVDDSVFNEFVEKFKKVDEDMFKVAFAIFAKQKGIDNLKMKKIKQNKNKSFAESEISTDVETGEKMFESNKDKEKYYESAFPDWNNDGNIY